ncbi:3-deoxy-manno-octulosonate cytidylyltransferase [Desulfuromonas sp. AOP6]|uniref:3-deoxy-manno-octulosonate cytidylyltransferase n=1 Tax=Desulfuromonas sp. AOP6 TaxID=1566351 RepID=UPI001270EC2A|nr:3-deoxy-manno-octulosonate cytidylyltransferase [Desulfuromonas sp. AOP6]BCA79541.1 3-deoxy-manno-octulosonate cytidylyltransferase [Desulfuromonas sp. AOP6]
MVVTAIIPARFASTRFPGKPLADLMGKPMIQWVYERTMQAEVVDKVIVATDDHSIYDAVQAFGGVAAMTCGDHPTGTDRLAEVAATLKSDLIVNVQGDEPLIDPAMIEAAVRPLLHDPSIPMGTLKTPIRDAREFLSPHVVKVVTDHNDFALYFSRSPIPYPRDFYAEIDANPTKVGAFKHVGLYVYRRDFLISYPHLPATHLERTENLEQLRALEHGYRIKVVSTDLISHGVDTPEDLDRVRGLLTTS